LGNWAFVREYSGVGSGKNQKEPARLNILLEANPIWLNLQSPTRGENITIFWFLLNMSMVNCMGIMKI
jgi:hypothetical protein